MTSILPRRSPRLIEKAAAAKHKKQKEDLAEVLAELGGELEDLDEIPEEEPWTCTFCGNVNSHDEPRCAMDRITPHVAPTSWTGPALSHPPCPSCTTPCPPALQRCPACNNMLQ